MTVNVYMVFNGNCEEAVEYYGQVFDTEPGELSRFGDMPSGPGQELPEEMKERIMPCELGYPRKHCHVFGCHARRPC